MLVPYHLTSSLCLSFLFSKMEKNKLGSVDGVRCSLKVFWLSPSSPPPKPGKGLGRQFYMDRLEAGGGDLQVPAPISPDSSFWDSYKTLIDIEAFK